MPNYPFLKTLLTRIGARLSAPAMHRALGLVNYLYAGWWMKSRGYRVPVRDPDREELYVRLAAGLPEPVTFLEFGVYRGDSLRRWSQLLPHAETRFYGFDSFEGLPEDWRLAASRATFDLGGRMPVFEDARIRLCKGWFSDTLPGFLAETPLRAPLILHLDADLYSSTRYVLEQMRPHLVPGTVLLFDEFFDREHELKALDEFLGQTALELECLGATATFTQVAFRVVKSPGP